MKVFNEKDIRKNVRLNEEAVAAVEEGFNRLQAGETQMPPIMRVDIPDYNGEVDVKSAYVRGESIFAIKMSSGFFDNHQLGLPSGNGLMVLFNSKTGVPEAVLLDNGYLTDVRTAAAGAITAKYLAPKKVETAGVIGAGTQARFQMKALKQVRDFHRILVYAHSDKRLDDFAAEMKKSLGVEVAAVDSPEKVVKESEAVVTTTPAKQPVLRAEWLHPGLHITAMGSDAEEKNELEPQILERADILACDVKSQCFRLGELHHAAEAGRITNDTKVIELGEMTSLTVTGRTDEKQITVCDLTGTGVQDTAIAAYALRQFETRAGQ
ncbi:MAG TPA: cyclodeaminase [Bacillales bacterium]|nr:cyclodeaminase [Bacillales bacterium]